MMMYQLTDHVRQTETHLQAIAQPMTPKRFPVRKQFLRPKMSLHRPAMVMTTAAASAHDVAAHAMLFDGPTSALMVRRMAAGKAKEKRQDSQVTARAYTVVANRQSMGSPQRSIRPHTTRPVDRERTLSTQSVSGSYATAQYDSRYRSLRHLRHLIYFRSYLRDLLKIFHVYINTEQTYTEQIDEQSNLINLGILL